MDELVRTLDLRPHPEGGFYKETYRAPAMLAGTRRSVCTAIYYLLGRGQRSRLHRIDSDELWHFYRGDALEIVELTRGGVQLTRLSPEHPQHLVPGGTWFGARPAAKSEWSLVGCTVSPAFEFDRFELGDRDALLREFPFARAEIEALT
ncbi:MAG: cupin domain-containing protein [Myxococcaceae bacterium]